ncbi:MAG: glycosyltransferase family 39 protein [Myxococcales bacterium]|nr:glycosyltransferase family 39 protein [Myxococcales bacterium]
MTTRALAATVLGVTAAVWLPALLGGFVWDDVNNLVITDRLHHWSALPQVFQQPAMWSAGADAGAIPTWRPLALASFVIDHQLFGPAAWGYHLSSVLWHLAAMAALFAGYRRLVSPARAAVMTLLCAVHPAAVEAVAWINGRSEIFALLAGAGAVIVVAGGLRWRRVPALAALLALALLAKESGLIFFPVALALAAAQRSGRRLPPAAGWVAAALGLALALGLRAQAAGAPAIEDPLSLLAALPSVWYRALQASLVPTDLGIVVLGPWIASLSVAERVLHGVVAAALVGGGLAAWWRGRSLAAIGIAWWLGALLPAALLVPLGWPGLQRWLYIALPGLVLAGGDLLRGGRGLRAAVVAVLALFVLQTERGIQVWSTEEDLYLHTLDEDPTSSLALANLGALLLSREQIAPAEALLARALGATPPQPGVALNLARAIARQDRCDEAVALLQRTPEDGPPRGRALRRIGECYQRVGDAARAQVAFRACAPIIPACRESLRP